jgi:hypothetical protein
MDLRNWPMLKVKKARPMAATAKNCGQMAPNQEASPLGLKALRMTT